MSSGQNYSEYKGCPLHAKTLANILGVKNAVACDLLKKQIEMGVIERVGGYIPGSKSYSYRFPLEPNAFTTITASPQYSYIPDYGIY